MAIENDIQKIFDLAHHYEQIAGDAFSSAAKKYPSGGLEFNQAYHCYVTTMQNVRNVYYLVSHEVTQKVVSGTDLKKIVDATKELQDSLYMLQDIENKIAIALKVLTVAATVTTAIIDPTHVTASAAAAAVASLIAEVASDAKSAKNNRG